MSVKITWESVDSCEVVVTPRGDSTPFKVTIGSRGMLIHSVDGQDHYIIDEDLKEILTLMRRMIVQGGRDW